MDPVSALGAAAAALQFAEASIKVTKRVIRYLERSVELPPELKAISARLKVLQCCLADIERRLKLEDENPTASPEQVKAVGELLSNVKDRCQQLETLFAANLPKESDSSLDLFNKGLKSLSKDKEISGIATSLTADVSYLTLSESTFRKGSEPSVVPQTGQPALGSKPISNIPYDRRSSYLVARGEVLTGLEEALEAPASVGPRVAVLSGMGGQGKTQLALEFCRRAEESQQYVGLFWVDAADMTTASISFGGTLEYLCPDKVLSDTSSRVRLTKDILKSWSKPWLLIFDNYDDPSAYNIREYFPSSSAGCVIITTRSTSLSGLGKTVQAPGMTESQSLELLFSRSGITRDENTERHAKDIVERLGYLPLAIAQSGAYLREMDGSLKIEGFLEFYERRTRRLLSTTPDVWDYLEHTSSAAQSSRIKSVFTTWNFSLDLLQKRGQFEEKAFVLSLFGFFAIADISESLFKSYFESFKEDHERPSWLGIFEEDGNWSTDNFADLIAEFKKSSLISAGSRSDQDGMMHITIHPLVRDWVMLRLEPSARLTCFETSAQMLAHDLLSHYWCYRYGYDNGFSHSLQQQKPAMAHVRSWQATRERIYKKPTPILLSNPRHDAALTVEGVIGEFRRSRYELAESRELLEWVWSHTGPGIPRWPEVYVSSAESLCNTLYEMESPGFKKQEIARRTCEVLSREGDVDLTILRRARLLLSFHEEEARSLVEFLAENPELNKRDRQFCQARLSKRWIGLQEDAKAQTMLRAILAESDEEKCGGEKYRRENWTLSMWTTFGWRYSDSSRRKTLSQELIEARGRSHGPEFTFFPRMIAARAVNDAGQILQAHKMLSACISDMERAGASGQQAGHDFYLLGDTLERTGRPQEAATILSRAIQSFLDASSPNWYTLVQVSSQLASCCHAINDRDGAMHAATLGIGFAGNIDSSDPTLMLDTLIYAHLDAARWCANGQAVDHCDQAIAAWKQRAMHLTRQTASSAGVGPSPWEVLQLGDYFLFDLLVRKAYFLVYEAQFEEGKRILRDSMDLFEKVPVIQDEDVWRYVEEVWSALICAVEGPDSSFGVSAIIAWTCKQTRRRVGDGEKTKERMRKMLAEDADLMAYLPSDELYTLGLQATVEKGEYSDVHAEVTEVAKTSNDEGSGMEDASSSSRSDQIRQKDEEGIRGNVRYASEDQVATRQSNDGGHHKDEEKDGENREDKPQDGGIGGPPKEPGDALAAKIETRTSQIKNTEADRTNDLGGSPGSPAGSLSSKLQSRLERARVLPSRFRKALKAPGSEQD